MAEQIKFLKGLQADYDAATKVATTFYYTTDTEKLYLGEVCLNNTIIDVTELPTENINENAFYRLPTGCFILGGLNQPSFICHFVDGLPEVGEPALDMDNAKLNIYYNTQDGALYTYLDATSSSAVGISVGWHPADTLLEVLEITYGGVITDISEDPGDNVMRLLLQYELYSYKEAWTNYKKIGWSGDGLGSEVFNIIKNKAYGDFSHAEGFETIAEGDQSHAEGSTSHAEGLNSHAEGYYSHAKGSASHAEGGGSHAEGLNSHAEGSSSYAEGDQSHAEGSTSHAEGFTSHAEGYLSHAEGRGSHAEGNGDYWTNYISGEANALTYTYKNSLDSDIEVGQTVRLKREGAEAGNEVGYTYSTAKITAFDTTAKTITVDRTLSDIAITSLFVIGYISGIAQGDAAHTEGNQNIAKGKAQHVQGEYNVPDSSYTNTSTRAKYAHIVGNGTSHTARSNAHTIDWSGLGWFAGGLKVGGTGQDDENAKAIATEEYVDNALSGVSVAAITTAEIDEICGATIYGASEVEL